MGRCLGLQGGAPAATPSDECVLYQFDRIIAKHGLDRLLKLQRQDVQWVRGSATPLQYIAERKADANFTSFYYLNPPATDTVRMIRLTRRRVKRRTILVPSSKGAS